ncbi:hypothetical protein XELAEV_18027864mg [Xenopus laevis]|uniref:G-protein coupled receptors family 1 profile domain-containing protein n=1 Tax=Xenopus laevis TaxID=8355 RepID=A0A974CYB4_XENLA|nr:hypothetical protein XELAEV_18027864mg [Xenopus laevis]
MNMPDWYVNCSIDWHRWFPGSPFNKTSDNDFMGEMLQCVPPSSSELWIFLIPSAIFSVFTLLANPLILVAIIKKEKLRKETRYILLANVMVSDLIFLLFNTIISTCNAIRWYLHKIICFTMIAFTFAAYCNCVLTFTVMVIDTYIAICFPLRYYSLLSLPRTRKVLLAIWIFSILYPLCVFLATEAFDMHPLEKQNMCLMLLYKMTKESGIWVRRFSRARVTLLTHSILLGLYIVPAFILAAEIMVFKDSEFGITARLWMSAANNAVIMMMPRALAPVLYGLRYRDISATLRHWFSRKRVSCHSSELCN